MKKKKSEINAFIQEYLNEVKNALTTLDTNTIQNALNMIINAHQKGKRVFIFGNGGSASTASHMACDLGKGTLSRFYDNKEKRLRVMSLNDNMALLTAYANDLSFEHAFVQQLKNLVEKGDLVIVLSGSGNSKNLIKAIKYAKDRGAKTIGILGFKHGGKLAEMVDCGIIVQSSHYGPVEDIHLVLNHLLASCFAKIKREYEIDKPAKNKAVPYPNNFLVEDVKIKDTKKQDKRNATVL
ncbi:MAG TPA: SIS domain-containing protein [Candidatus Acidoferrales bacterium]|nr:SIS domain-containing protein [Candidatus Acidoferrales bacterium]